MNRIRNRLTARFLLVYAALYVLVMVAYHALGGPTGDFVYYGAMAFGSAALAAFLDRKVLPRSNHS
jgi:hypothetical protein